MNISKKKRNFNSLRSELFATKPKEGETTICWIEICRIIADLCELEKFGVVEADQTINVFQEQLIPSTMKKMLSENEQVRRNILRKQACTEKGNRTRSKLLMLALLYNQAALTMAVLSR